MLTYILEVSICWGAFYLLYWLLLSRETFFHFNRWYLVATLLASLVIPAVEWQLPAAQTEIATVYFQPITVGVEALEVTVTATAINSSIGVLEVLTWIYWAGMAFFMLRFLVGIRQIYRLYRRSEKRYRNGYQLILSEKAHPPFSFFNRLFISKSVELDTEDREAILRHELAHIRGGHSIDILVLEILNAIFWCSPFIYLYRRSLRNVHEYIADAAVLRTTQRKQYGHLLIRQSQSGPAIAIANHFHSQLKKRILMMMRNPSKRRAMLQYLLVLPLTLLVLLVFSNADAKASMQQQAKEMQQNIQATANSINITDKENTYSFTTEKRASADTIPYDGKSVIPIPKEVKYIIYYPGGTIAETSNTKAATDQIKPYQIEKIDVNREKNIVSFWLKGQVPFQEVDEMASFPGCEGEKDITLRQRCANNMLMSYIAKNVRYPKAAREQNVEGDVLVSFVVNEKGQVQSPKVLRGISKDCDEEVLRIIKEMPTWTPAKKDGKPVASELTIPVKFKLQSDNSKVVTDPKTYENHIKSMDDVVVVGYPLNAKQEEMLNEFNAIMKGFNNMSQEQKQQAVEDFDKLIKKFIQKYPDKKEEVLTTFVEALKQNDIKITDGFKIKPGDKVEGTEIFKVVEEMPRFPGCEDEVGNDAEKKNCADRKMLEFVYQNIKYPKEAREKSIEGMTVVSFIVGKDGIIREPKIVRGIGGGCDEETLRMINLMKEQEVRWIPGKQRGRAVDVQFNLPVRFKLDNPVDKEEGSFPPPPRPSMTDLPANTLQLQNFKASPNPTNGVLNLSFKGEKKPTVIKVFDLQGRELQSLNLKNFDGTFNEQLDLSKSDKGVLVISVIQGEQSYTEKIIVQ